MTTDKWAYQTVVWFTQGHSEVVYSGFDADASFAALDRVCLTNGKISRVEIRDREGVLRTLWAKDWENQQRESK